MRYWIAALAVLALTLGLGSAAVAEDAAAVEAVATQWAEAWNAGDLDAVGALYADDADYVDFFGQSVKGKPGIQAAFAEIHATVYKGSKISIETTSVQFAKPDVAVSDTVWELSDVPKTEGPAIPTKGESTAVMVNADGEWKIVAQRTRIPAPLPEE